MPLKPTRQCRLCDKKGRTTHHLVPQRIKRIQAKVNLLPLCKGCHMALHGNRGFRTAYEYRLRLRLTLTDDELAFIVARTSQDFLDDEYPSPSIAWRVRDWFKAARKAKGAGEVRPTPPAITANARFAGSRLRLFIPVVKGQPYGLEP